MENIYYIKDIHFQQIFRPRKISDTSTSEKLYDREIKMYFNLANVGFEPTPTSTAAPSNTETAVIPTRPLRYPGQCLCLISLHYPSDRITRFTSSCSLLLYYISLC